MDDFFPIRKILIKIYSHHFLKEQQQQIQSLISANRELIWAFNESRREHEELMKQLKTLMASNSNKNINNNSNGNVGQQQIGGGNNSNSTSNQQQQQQKQQPVVPKMEVVVPRRILSKTSTNTNKSSSDLQRSEKSLDFFFEPQVRKCSGLFLPFFSSHINT